MTYLDSPDSGRRDHAPSPERDGSPPEPLAPAAPPMPQYCFTGNDVGLRFYLHRTLHRQWASAYRADCGRLAYELPARVKPMSPHLEPCRKCFPDGRVDDRTAG